MAVKDLVVKYVDLEGLAVEGILEGMVFVKLDEIVLDSKNTLDDAMVAMIKPLIKSYVAEQIQKLKAAQV